LDLDNDLVKYAKNNPDKNLAGQIMFSDFNIATLNAGDTSFDIGEFVLVQALVMPGRYDPEPIAQIRNIRTQSDTTKQIFSRLGKLMAGENIDPRGKELLKEFFNDVREYGDDPEEMQIYIEDLINNFEALEKKGSLSQYKKKRDFIETPEPKGKKSKKNQHRFVIQKHDADKAGLHFDLRLENDKGTLSSWSIPKHKLPSGSEKLLAVKTEDHPIEYMDFKGKIPSGYGKGNVKIHDKGTYKELDKSTNKIIFTLRGKKEKGTYNLIKTDKNWIITKNKGD